MYIYVTIKFILALISALILFKNKDRKESLRYSLSLIILILSILSLIESIIIELFYDFIKEYSLSYLILSFMQMILFFILLMNMRKENLLNKDDYKINNLLYNLWVSAVCLIFVILQFNLNIKINYSFIKDTSISSILLCILLAITTGIFEEHLTRSYLIKKLEIKYGKTKKGFIKTILYSSIVFGLLHLFNIYELELSLIIETLSQVLYASIIGLYFALIYYQTKSLLMPIFLHAFIDASSFILLEIFPKELFETIYDESIIRIFITLIVCLPYIIAIILKLNKILKEFKDNELDINDDLIVYNEDIN